jgi:hypothetical protein
MAKSGMLAFMAGQLGQLAWGEPITSYQRQWAMVDLT